MATVGVKGLKLVNCNELPLHLCRHIYRVWLKTLKVPSR